MAKFQKQPSSAAPEAPAAKRARTERQKKQKAVALHGHVEDIKPVAGKKIKVK